MRYSNSKTVSKYNQMEYSRWCYLCAEARKIAGKDAIVVSPGQESNPNIIVHGYIEEYIVATFVPKKKQNWGSQLKQPFSGWHEWWNQRMLPYYVSRGYKVVNKKE
jgi:hypothetical protein